MAADDSNKIVVTEQDGAIDSILTYLKERIESPFLMSFMFSWAVINRDFLFYLFLSHDKNKHEQLTSWKFSSFVFSNDLITWHSPWASSFWFPMFYGVLMALLFSPISMLLSGCRYYLLSKVASFTQNNKDYFDLAHAIDIAKNKLKLIDREITRKNVELENIVRSLRSTTEKLEKTKVDYAFSCIGVIAPFLIESAKFDSKYKSGVFPIDAGKDSPKLKANAIIKVVMRYLDNSPFSKQQESKSIDFEGSVFDFFTNGEYFKLNDESSIELSIESIQRIIHSLSIAVNVECKIVNGTEVTVNLMSCKVYQY